MSRIPSRWKIIERVERTGGWELRWGDGVRGFKYTYMSYDTKTFSVSSAWLLKTCHPSICLKQSS